MMRNTLQNKCVFVNSFFILFQKIGPFTLKLLWFLRIPPCISRKHLNKEELDEIFDPMKYIGLAPQEVDRVITATMKFREADDFR